MMKIEDSGLVSVNDSRCKLQNLKGKKFFFLNDGTRNTQVDIDLDASWWRWCRQKRGFNFIEHAALLNNKKYVHIDSVYTLITILSIQI